jgi:hypothetical protein
MRLPIVALTADEKIRCTGVVAREMKGAERMEAVDDPAGLTWLLLVAACVYFV